MNQQEKEEYHRRYETFKERGHSFWPYNIFEDTVMALLVLGIILFLLVTKGVLLESQADPTNTAYIPRPEWYFMFLFESLKLFPGELEWVGVVVVPTVAILILLLLPFYDRNPFRLPSHRPVAMSLGSLAIMAIVFLTIQAYRSTPTVESGATGERLTPIQQVGKSLYDTQNCGACHSIGGTGGNAGPPLDGIGQRRDEVYIHSYIENPKALNPQAQMPAFLHPLSHVQVEQLTQYLMGLK